MPKTITEATTLQSAEVDSKTGHLQIGIITPGFGSSGYYSPEVLEAAATDRVFPKGTLMHFDHPTESETFERPERSVLTIGAVLEEDAHWDGKQLVAEASPVAPYRELLTDKVFASAIGVSIRAAAEVEEGEVDGKSTTIVSKLIEGKSVDFVTQAGRGGSILNVYESARPSRVNARAVRHGITEATVNDRREALSTLVRDEYGAEKIYVWLRDFDETTAWFEIETGDDTGVWQQSYTTGDNDLPNALTGDRVEVRVSTQYVPVSPAGPSPTEESEEDTMATTQIEETELSGLREKAGRVSALESERDTEKARADKAEADLAEARKAIAEADRGKRLDQIIAEAETEFTDLEKVGLKAQAQVKEDGALDEDAFAKIVAEAAAKVAEAHGAGKPRGNGQRPGTTDSEVSEADLDKLDDAIFGAVKEG
jgi:hypothetical protein